MGSVWPVRKQGCWQGPAQSGEDLPRGKVLAIIDGLVRPKTKMSGPGTQAVRKRKPGRPPVPGLAEMRREQILAAASALFAKHGYAGTDLQGVASVLRVGKGTVYRYFGSKRALFEAAVRRVMSLMSARIEAAIEGLADPLDKLAQAIRSYLEFFHEHPEYVELLIQERAEFPERKKPTYFEHREAKVGRWHEVYRGLIRAGRIRPMAVERITDCVGDLIYGTMFANCIASRSRNLDEQVDSIVDLVLHGLLTEAERTKRPVRRREDPA